MSGATSSALDTCVSYLEPRFQTQEQISISNEELISRINRRYKKNFNFYQRLALSTGEGMGVRRPFELLESSTLLPFGELPELGRINEVIIVRKSLKAGLEELRRSLSMAEERAWIFIPSLQIWFYDTGKFSGENFVAHNAILGPILQAEFGELESYHTHPDVAVEREYQANLDFFNARGLSFDQTKPLAALPSSDDLDALNVHYRHAFDQVAGHVVSSLGVVQYRIQKFSFERSNEVEMILPGFGVIAFEDVDVLHNDLPAQVIVIYLLRKAHLRSKASVEYMRDVAQWKDDEAPQVNYNFTPW